jgi:hypothetical protein
MKMVTATMKVVVRLTHLSDDIAITKLLLYAGTDAAAQSQLFCQKYELIEGFFLILTKRAAASEQDYLRDLSNTFASTSFPATQSL